MREADELSDQENEREIAEDLEEEEETPVKRQRVKPKLQAVTGPSGMFVVGFSGNTAFVWDAVSGMDMGNFRIDGSNIAGIAFDQACGKLYVLYHDRFSPVVQAWDVASKEIALKWTAEAKSGNYGFGYGCNCLDIADDGSLFVTSLSNDVVNANNGELVTTLAGSRSEMGVHAIAFTRNSEWISRACTGSESGPGSEYGTYVQIFEAHSGIQLKSIKMRFDRPTGLSKDGMQFYCGESSCFSVGDLSAAVDSSNPEEVLQTGPAHVFGLTEARSRFCRRNKHHYHACLGMQHGRMIAIRAMGTQITVMDMETKEVKLSFDIHFRTGRVCYSPHGNAIVVELVGKHCLWYFDADTGAKMATTSKLLATSWGMYPLQGLMCSEMGSMNILM